VSCRSFTGPPAWYWPSAPSASWLGCSRSPGKAFAILHAFANSTLGKITQAAFIVALVYHFLNGIRHLLWDIGWGYELPRAYASGYVVITLTVILSALIAYLGLATGAAA